MTVHPDVTSLVSKYARNDKEKIPETTWQDLHALRTYREKCRRGAGAAPPPPPGWLGSRPPHITQISVAWLCDRYCDACVTSTCTLVSTVCANDLWVQSWGFDMSNLHDWSWTSIKNLLWKEVQCACISRKAQQSAHVACSVYWHDCLRDAVSYNLRDV